MRSKTTGGLLIVIIGLMGMVGVMTGCGELPDDAAAQVNGEIITKADVDKRVEDLRRSYGPMVPQEDANQDGELDVEYTNYRRDVTQSLVGEMLFAQEAEKKDITASEEEIDGVIQATADDGFLGDVERWQQSQYDRGYTEEEIRSDISRQIVYDKVLADEIGAIEFTDEDLQNYYDNSEEYQIPERRTARQLVVSSEAAAQQAVARARAGEEFIDLVRELSEDPTVLDKIGSLGLLKQGDLAPELDAVVFSLGTLEISDPVKLGEQWYVLTVETIIPPTDISFEEAREDIEYFFRNQQAALKQHEYEADIVADADIEYAPDYDPEGRTVTEPAT